MGNRSFVHRWHAAMWRLSLGFLVLYFIAVTWITVAALADVIWGLGWGYGAQDVWIGLGMLGFGVAFYFFLRVVFTIVGGLNNRFYGTDRER